MITARAYQTQVMQQIKDAYVAQAVAPIVVMPTGSGKTTVFASMAESAEKRGKRVLILCHRIELVDQIVDRLKEFAVTPDIIAAGYNRSAGRERVGNRSIAVASVQTLVKRLDSYAAPTLIVIDECHHISTGGTWHQILNRYRTAKRLGFTATPIRLDGRGLAAHFDKLIVGPSVAELTVQGYLAPARIFAPPTVDTSGLHIRMGEYQTGEAEALLDTPTITGDAFSHYRKHADGLPALVFCTSVAHAHHVAERFRKEKISAIALDGGTDKYIRRMAVQDFKDGKIQVLTNCDLFGEGVDLVGCHVGIFLRPTASLGLYLQQCGRILRPAPGKSHAILLDHVNNASRHGLPSEDREWTLTADVMHKKKKTASVRVCPKCFAASAARATQCIECGHVFEVKPRQEVEEREGELVELTAEQIAKKRERREQGWKATTLAKLQDIERIKKYKPGWALHVYQAREAKKLRKENA